MNSNQPKTKKTIKPFKRPPKKYQPKGMTIIYEDHDIVVVNKTNGLLTVRTEKIKENTALNHLNSYVQKGNPKSSAHVLVVHRLDRDTSGILIFAKSEKAKAYLMDEWKNFTKKYYAIVTGILPEKQGIIESYLAENSIYKMYSVQNPEKGKFAKTGYKVIKESKHYSLLEIDLYTGKKNQIRVHLSEKGFPIAGDKMYGHKDKFIKRLTLHSTSLSITHPYTHEPMTFEAKIPAYFETFFKKF
ncbi:MAG: RluA family pseudouridine synthase [Kiritimatiellae bacterium]|jgi:23S rRNA pseudouridine1911/1915/1917 synthase|nr:RluA family pseudouridine synthase [Kiritimatiellia bacterium]